MPPRLLTFLFHKNHFNESVDTENRKNIAKPFFSPVLTRGMNIHYYCYFVQNNYYSAAAKRYEVENNI